MNTNLSASRRVRVIAVAAVAIVMLLVILTIVAKRGGSTAAKGSGSPSAKGVAGMAGMTATSNGTVALSADQIRTFGVTFGTAEIRQLIAETRTTGVKRLV